MRVTKKYIGVRNVMVFRSFKNVNPRKIERCYAAKWCYVSWFIVSRDASREIIHYRTRCAKQHWQSAHDNRHYTLLPHYTSISNTRHAYEENTRTVTCTRLPTHISAVECVQAHLVISIWSFYLSSDTDNQFETTRNITSIRHTRRLSSSRFYGWTVIYTQ